MLSGWVEVRHGGVGWRDSFVFLWVFRGTESKKE